MIALNDLKRDILRECEEDHVGLWSVVRDTRVHFPDASDNEIQDTTLKVLGELLSADEIVAGHPAADGQGFVQSRLCAMPKTDSVTAGRHLRRMEEVGQRPDHRGNHLVYDSHDVRFDFDVIQQLVRGSLPRSDCLNRVRSTTIHDQLQFEGAEMPEVPAGTVRDTGAKAGDVLAARLPAHAGMRIQIEQDEPGGAERVRLGLRSLLKSPFRLLDAGVTGFDLFGFVGKVFASGADFKAELLAKGSSQWKSVAVENLIVER